jgi:hypothetical protein
MVDFWGLRPVLGLLQKGPCFCSTAIAGEVEGLAQKRG